ncbi:LTA synthase family protein [Sphingomonas sp. BIUV-7]|uniref:LTA synthase family protein n=1 Tax=Sphingomonas natans TaxID=3063330 RepID=A0ABT8Y5U6_9SPHN|nr:LTA synthase family protein [Sphingomonas sp. BIUV-7]MDO6413696.1 LTA synthase family protein [Sphingomonas sp. BIUV-7]
MAARFAIGLLLALVTWAGLRRMVGAPVIGRRPAPLALDALAPLLGFLLFTLATARPIVAGIGIVALGIGLGVADRVKRAILDEPVVFADRAELLEVVRHPRFYIAFVGTAQMVAGTIAIAALVAGILRAEPPLWHLPLLVQIGLAALAAAIGRAAFVVPASAVLRGRLAGYYRSFAPTGDPEIDAKALGLLASCIVHATLASDEREPRRAAVRARGLPAWPKGVGPVVLLQGESFVDARRLHPDLADRLPHFAQLRAQAALSGRLTVPCWGANTIRSELAAVAGIGPEALGLDRFNPYEHFAQAPLPSLAQAAREAGCKAIFVHPYARNFYARDKVMPMLGFERFIGEEAFVDAERDGGYVTDAALARFAADLIAREGPDLFLFVVTIENHGPWDGSHDHVLPSPLPPSWQVPDRKTIGRWLRHAEATDAMIPVLRGAIEQHGKGWLGFYGDHQPSLAGAFTGAGDRRTDYALWPVGNAADPRREDIAAEDIAGRLLGLMASRPAR